MIGIAYYEEYAGTSDECSEFVKTLARSTDWEIKKDGIVQTDSGDPRYLVLIGH